MNPNSTIIKMPLSRLAFTNPQTVGKKNLYSIEEGDDEGSLNSSGEDDVLSLLSKSGTRQSTSLSATKPSDSSSFISKQLGKLSQSVLEIQQKLQDNNATTANETSRTILQRLSASEEKLSTILTGMQQLQLQMTNFDKDHANHKEALLSLKLAAENERNVLQTQMNNVKSRAAEQQSAYEKEISLLNQEIDEFEYEKKQMFMEKEKLNKKQIELDKSEALFEQRKIAAQDDMDHAERTMSSLRDAENRLSEEMERLHELSEHVRQKNIEAQDKLNRAEQLESALHEKETSLRQEAENIKKQRQEIAEQRMDLTRERVSLLKERSRDKRSVCEGSTRSYHDLGLMQPDVRRTLLAIQNDLNN